MLVLQLKQGEYVQVGNDIVVYLAQLKPGSVRLGFEAPREVRIMRGELLEKDASSETPAQSD